MLNFGKYRGRALAQVIDYDKQYMIWIANNIANIDNKLDDEDKLTLFKYAFPYDFIKQKYGIIISSSSIDRDKEEEIIKILKDEGIVSCAHSCSESDGGVGCTIKTFYGSTYGTTIGGGNYQPTHCELMSRICEHLDKASEWFKDYIAIKADIKAVS